MNNLLHKITDLFHSRNNTNRRSSARKASRQRVLESLEPRTLLTASLLRDINTSTPLVAASNPTGIMDVNGLAYFAATAAGYGIELWKTDGTTNSATMLRDIAAGTVDSSPANITNVSGAVFFTANDGANGAELWKTDGTTNGTVMVRDIFSGSNSSNASNLTNVNGTLYFTANDGLNGTELWKSDGTAAGTVMVKDILAGTGSGSPSSLMNVNGTLYFRAIDANGSELWKSDGTAAGTVMVKDILTGSSSGSPNFFANVNGTLYFSANDGVNGNELWMTNGTAIGTVMVKDVFSGASNGSPSNLTNVNGTLYFRATDGANGYELWKSNGTATGTVMVKDVFSGASNGSPSNLTNVNGTLYFRARDGVNGYELWKSNGTATGTVMVKDVFSGASSGSPSNLTNVNGTLYFVATDGTNGAELWKSDGTATGTVMVKDVFSGASSGSLSNLTNVNGTLYFRANDGINGYQLWSSGGTAGSTVPNTSLNSRTSSSAAPMIDVSGNYFFAATDGVSGFELWKTDGSSSGTTMVKDIFPGAGKGVTGLNFTNVNGTLFFVATDGTNGYELWRSNGTDPGTVMVKDILAGNGGFGPQLLTNVNGTLYFRANDGVNGYELWKSDGTAPGTIMVKEIISGSSGGNVGNLTNVNGTVYFTANDGVNGSELWKSNGTATGTVMVSDISPGSLSSSPSLLTNVNGTLYFRATDGTTGYELWKSNGVASGTELVKDIRLGFGGSTPAYLSNVNGTLYFLASDLTAGVELWRSDGTENGTALVRDINPGTSNGALSPLTNLNGSVYFRADDGLTGFELWKSDGTAAGTQNIKDIWAGPGSSGRTSAIARFHDWNIFVANDGLTGEELWIADGSSSGAHLLSDIFVGSGGSNPTQLSTIGNQLSFWADTFESGRELWSLTAPLGGVADDGVLTIDLSKTTSTNQSLVLRSVNGKPVLFDATTNTALFGPDTDFPVANMQGLRFTGSSVRNETLTIDLSSGSLDLPQGIVFDGRDFGGDNLSIIGATGVDASFSWSGVDTTISLSSGLAVTYRNVEALNMTGMRRVSVGGEIRVDIPISVSHQLPLDLGSVTTLFNGSITSNGTVALGSGESIVGGGTITGRISAEAGSLIHADGPMTLGTTSSVLGFLTRGDLETEANTVTLLDANQAVLGSGTILGTTTSTGTVVAANGALIDFGNNLIGYGTLQTPNLSSKPTLINGAVQGNSLAQPITLTGYIKGVGTLDNVSITGTYSPGFSPAAVTLGNMVYSGTSTTVIELAGTIPGTEYDQLNHIGQALLGGTLHVDLLNGYQPTLGCSYTILTATAGLLGTFSSVELPALSGNLSWQVVYGTNELVLNVVQNNVPPSDISLSGTTVPENSGANSVIGTLSGSDPNIGDSLTFSLPANTANNNQFNISGTSLRANDSFDFEGGGSYSITVRATDAGGLSFDKSFTITVTNVNESPTDISLPNTLVAENLPTGTNVGSFQTVDPDSGNTFTYALVTGTGSDHNANFTIVGDTLKTATTFNFEGQSSYSIRVRSTDQNGLYVEKVFTIQITNVTELGGIDTQLGQTQRSYVRYLDVLFDRPDDIMSMVNNGRFQLTRMDLNGLNPSGVALSPGMFSAVGNSARLDFGVNGLGGNRNTTAGDGYYELGVDMDGNGSYESKKYFYRLLGDVNGDRKVDSTDSSLVTSAFGTTNPNRDVNGDGIVNANDRTLVLRSIGRKLKDDLFADD